MRVRIVTILLFIITTVSGQDINIKVLLDSAKTLFKKERNFSQEELDKFDYNQVKNILNIVLTFDPNNAEARYFLGNTYGRLNSRDGRNMTNLSPYLTIKSSEEFEKVNKLTKKYTGEIIILDPYSKISSEWGSLGMNYLYNNKRDSAIWAFKEGKKRGGFGNFILAMNRKMLDACSKNSILITSGDNFTIPLWYLQTIENYRKDVSVVNISLLNSKWYPNYLAKNKIIKFGLTTQDIDTISGVLPWSDSTITINHFSWKVKPSFSDHYILRGDKIFLSLLKQNNFEKDIFFTLGFVESSRLGLGDYLSSQIVIDKLTPQEKLKSDFIEYYNSIIKLLKLSINVNVNSHDESESLDYIRYSVFDELKMHLYGNEKTKAKRLLNLLDKYTNENKYPYKQDAKKYLDYMREYLK